MIKTKNGVEITHNVNGSYLGLYKKKQFLMDNNGNIIDPMPSEKSGKSLNAKDQRIIAKITAKLDTFSIKAIGEDLTNPLLELK